MDDRGTRPKGKVKNELSSNSPPQKKEGNRGRFGSSYNRRVETALMEDETADEDWKRKLKI